MYFIIIKTDPKDPNNFSRKKCWVLNSNEVDKVSFYVVINKKTQRVQKRIKIIEKTYV